MKSLQIKLKHIKIAILLALLVVFALQFMRLQQLDQKWLQSQGEGTILRQSLPKIFTILKKANVKTEALGADQSYYNEYYKSLVREHKLRNAVFTYREEDNYWSLSLNNVSGQQSLQVIEKLSVRGLVPITVTIVEQKDNPGKYSGIIIFQVCCSEN